MPKIQKDMIVKGAQGIHARPAAMFVQIVSKYDSDVIVRKEGEEVNGRSIMGILTLGAQRNSLLTVIVNGDDAEPLMMELEQLLEKESLS